MHNHNDNVSVEGGFDALDYSYAGHEYKKLHASIQGEHSLWCAVIHQALTDMDIKNEKAEAERWLLRDNQDFFLICTLAGISPALVRRAAIAKTNCHQ